MTPFLEVQDLQLHYGTLRGPLRAVDGISFTLDEEGEALGIVGESGSGKTSLALALMRVLSRSVTHYSGSVRLEGRELMTLSDEEYRRQVRWRRIAMAFQGAMNAFNPVLRVGDQITEPLVVQEGLSRRDARRAAEEAVELVGLPRGTATRYPHELSGGMKQRALIAMALILKPRIVILDEPTSALDVSVQAQIMNLLKRLKREMGLSLLFVTHDIALASDICDRLAVAYGGRLVEQGTAEPVLLNPLHPYTQKLLASVPPLHGSRMPDFIPGAPPDLVEPPAGCRFHPRCPYAFELCERDDPPPLGAGEGRSVRCWLVRTPDPTP